MTEKEIRQRIDLLEKQLTLLHLYPEHFEEQLGKQGVQEFIDSRLDQLLELSKLLNNE